ncbi:MAG: hypothetical protein GY820_20135, partial [Gammaproteobacteria bacterium]|nr:hypothetical protein [Gammaproteobacteria bacterium]
PNVRASQKNTGQGPAISNYNNNNQIPSTSYGYNGQMNAGHAPAPKTVNFADERGDRNFCGNQYGQFQPNQYGQFQPNQHGQFYPDQNEQFGPNPNQNPPFPLQYEEQGFQGNFVLDDEGGDLYRIENNEGQGRYQNNGQNGNNGQNHNRNNQNNYKPPHQLCRRFGLHNDSSFDTFEFDFQLACEMYQVPAKDRVNWLLMHLEGSIKEHARSWMGSRGITNKPTYEELIGELRPSFQQEMS